MKQTNDYLRKQNHEDEKGEFHFIQIKKPKSRLCENPANSTVKQAVAAAHIYTDWLIFYLNYVLLFRKKIGIFSLENLKNWYEILLLKRKGITLCKTYNSSYLLLWGNFDIQRDFKIRHSSLAETI
ncbi:hypothetical protein [Bacillus haynesii]|uniref:hypothetical protein n=1 Tax=Bacillus haynesii TaxID=1925021 RepID=UPI00227DC80D|nr:hypothetical protein [Bacillus haynesii]MCY8371957.1 hypothetical protein [Bacillus haynesii]MEC1478325.1 hypothetical protein [Bacillus haynesii]